ncbi:MAG: hypothetical protein AAGJ18_18220 [Bacteroidota bacterium]
MTNRQFSAQTSGGGFNIIPALIFGVLFLVGLFYLARFVFNILYYLSPVLLIITLIIDHKVVINYGKWILQVMGRNPIFGVALTLMTIVAFPVVSLFLFGKAMVKKKVKEMAAQFGQPVQEEAYTEYTEYEEVTPVDEPLIELPPPPIKEKVKRRRGNRNEYEDLFEE